MIRFDLFAYVFVCVCVLERGGNQFIYCYLDISEGPGTVPSEKQVTFAQFIAILCHCRTHLGHYYFWKV